MTEDKTKIIERIQKILAMAGDKSNENQAAVAAEKAQALLIEHNLTLNDIRKKGGKDEGFVVDDDEALMTDAYPWRRKIGVQVAKLYFCGYFFQPEQNGKTKYDVHCFAGARHNIEVAKMMFQYLHKTVDRLAREGARSVPKQQRSPYRVTFRKEATNRLCIRIQKRIDDAKKGGTIKGESGNTLPALASLYDTAQTQVTEFIEKNLGKLETAREKKFKRENIQGRIDGRVAGDKIGLETQIDDKKGKSALPSPAPAIEGPKPARFKEYENTTGNAEIIGWNRVPHACSGNPMHPWVTHDTVLGTFKFHKGKK